MQKGYGLLDVIISLLLISLLSACTFLLLVKLNRNYQQQQQEYQQWQIYLDQQETHLAKQRAIIAHQIATHRLNNKRNSQHG